MGHYASEIDPDWAKNLKKIDRKVKLLKELESIPLLAFMATDLPALSRVVDQDVDADASMADIRHIESRVVRFNKLRRKLKEGCSRGRKIKRKSPK